jgi:methionyl-tRNA formyltransferase
LKKIIFMGTPDFAVPSLKALVESGFEVSLVVTQPDRPAGRGQRLQSPPIKTLAQTYPLALLQTESLRKDATAREQILSCEADFLVVVAFGQILPKEILDHPRVAPLNVHASLLPAYRGAAPIARAVMEQEKTTGVTIQWMVEALDMGDILHQRGCDIHENETSFDLHDRLKRIGSLALIECLNKFEKNEIVRIPQEERIGSYARKLEKSEARVNFDSPAFSIHRKIMGMNPWPVAECQLAGQRLRIFKSRFEARPAEAPPGSIVDIEDDAVIVACQDACIGLLELQMENRKRLVAAEFLKGYPLRKGLILGGV